MNLPFGITTIFTPGFAYSRNAQKWKNLTFSYQGENATLQYILIGANDKFDIRSSGQIVVKDNIDREEKSQYIFVV